MKKIMPFVGLIVFLACTVVTSTGRVPEAPLIVQLKASGNYGAILISLAGLLIALLVWLAVIVRNTLRKLRKRGE